MIETIRANLLEKGITFTGTLNAPYKVIVPLSGGKDSQACLQLVLNEYKEDEILCLFCDTRYEHPITYQHVIDVTEGYGVDLITLNAGSVLSVCLKYKRFPGGGARHCTDELKLRPSKFFYKELAKLQGQGYQIWCGIRSEESREREARYRGKTSDDLYFGHEFMPRKYPKYLAKLGVLFRLPVLDWSTSEIFELLDGTENPLYGEGFTRVGCFPCLAGGEEHQMRAFHFDEVGRKHFRIAEEIGESANRKVLKTKRYAGKGPGCAICSI